MKQNKMATPTLYCPHEENCEIYRVVSQHNHNQVKINVITKAPGEEYSCRVMVELHTNPELKDRRDYLTTIEPAQFKCSHIEILNLLSRGSN